MNNNLLCTVAGYSFTYQHLQGIMLVNLNKIADTCALSHAEYHLLGVLIGFWNMKEGKAFPSLHQLAKSCKMGKSTILKLLSHLNELNLLSIQKTGHNRNHYYFSDLFFKTANSSATKPLKGPACKTTLKLKQNRINKKRYHTKSLPNDNFEKNDYLKSSKINNKPLVKSLNPDLPEQVKQQILFDNILKKKNFPLI